ncbi:transcription termination factor NusA [Fundicoccus culcitae]|uniref:Transcription termination/antitermination protein NusA n=1 Tax=Fundicoccus culcitae TaxID=2969821 RepID=A0ABY5P7B6_9LACT|nr:transcription termination factor NusA [Fundicoccus culcitae]UUX34629.1 transcription termination factor NusA [Fundicoccus culcitae]
MSTELVKAMQVLEEEKGISRDVIKSALEDALELAYKRNYNQAQNVEVSFNKETGDIKVYSVREVVEINYDSMLEISLEEALKISPHYEIGDKIKFEVTPKDFGRIATQTAKHVIMQRIREAEREIIYEEYNQYQDEILTGIVERQDHRFLYVNLGKVEAVMPVSEQIPTEKYHMDDRIKVYVSKVDKTSKGAQVIVTRAQPEFLRRLFEQEVPEIYEGIVEIVNIAREAGDRSKVAVRSRDKNVDPVGTCIGPGGQRVQSIVRELNGENMDIIEWNEDPVIFIKNAMSPADVEEIIFDEANHSCIVVVPDHQLSLAIGKKGQNARLAARLTTYKIDIKSVSSYADYVAEQTAKEIEQKEAEGLEDDTIDELAVTDEVEVLDEDTIAADIDVKSEDLFADPDVSIAADGDDFYQTGDVEDLRNAQDIDEQEYTPEAVEDAIEAVEIDGEQDYDELVEEVKYEQLLEDEAF